MTTHQWSLLERHLLKKGVLEEGQTLANLPPAQVEVLEELWEHSFVDDLTGLGNRRALDRAIDSAFRHNESLPRNNPYGLNILFIDGDGVKRANDRFSYEVGDRYLISIADTLQEARPRQNEVFRRGGDEFVLQFAGDYNTLVEVSETILAELRGTSIKTKEGPLEVRASIGTSHIPPGHSFKRSQEGLSLAEEAMKYAKWQGQAQEDPSSVKIGDRIIHGVDYQQLAPA